MFYDYIYIYVFIYSNYYLKTFLFYKPGLHKLSYKLIQLLRRINTRGINTTRICYIKIDILHIKKKKKGSYQISMSLEL